jgi:hypothetical protein
MRGIAYEREDQQHLMCHLDNLSQRVCPILVLPIESLSMFGLSYKRAFGGGKCHNESRGGPVATSNGLLCGFLQVRTP